MACTPPKKEGPPPQGGFVSFPNKYKCIFPQYITFKAKKYKCEPCFQG